MTHPASSAKRRLQRRAWNRVAPFSSTQATKCRFCLAHARTHSSWQKGGPGPYASHESLGGSGVPGLKSPLSHDVPWTILA